MDVGVPKILTMDLIVMDAAISLWTVYARRTGVLQQANLHQRGITRIPYIAQNIAQSVRNVLIRMKTV